VLVLALASAAGGAAMSPALGQADDLNARKSQDRDRDDRTETLNHAKEQPQDEQASPQIRQVPHRGAQTSYEDSDRYSQSGDARPPVYYYPAPGMGLQTPGIRLYVPLDAP
jgi:hypothetical protein